MAGKLIMSCRMATELIEKKHRARLTWQERVQLPLHLALCDACMQYQAQSGLLERLFNARQQDDVASNSPQLPDELAGQLEWRILKKLDEQEARS